jgi:hypothetical protein
MKRCPKCGQVYTDDTLNFCLNDGELLGAQTGYTAPPTQYADDSPPTLLMNQPRVTNPIDWASPLANRQHSDIAATPQFAMVGGGGTLYQTLPTIALVTGIASIFMVCCAGGIWLGIPAAIFGFFALRNIESDPTKYGGRGMALAGIVIGIITFFASVFILIAGQL